MLAKRLDELQKEKATELATNEHLVEDQRKYV